MATTTIPWGDGSGDNIYLTYPSASGDQTVDVSSDANTGAARSKVVSITSLVGSITQLLTVNQEAGEIPGGRISDYVQDGLMFHLDGKNKGPTEGKWTDLIGGKPFTKSGDVVFNSDHLYFDGSGDSLYYYSSSFDVPGATAGTIEVVIDSELESGKIGAIFVPKSTNRMAAFLTDTSFVFFVDNTSARARYVPLILDGITKASISSNNSNAYENGTALSYSSSKVYHSGTRANYTYIGRRYNSTSGSDQYYFKGKIYSIRIYNKKLTQAEVLQNLSVDNIRFNLGLTLE